MFYELDRVEHFGSWDTFSTRNLGLQINRRMARDFDGDSNKLRQSSLAEVTQSINLNRSRWTSAQNRALEDWPLVLALIPDLARWTTAEKHQLIKIIRAKSAPSELPYLRQTQRHLRLREALLRLGSSHRK
jgi:hypothetical protein